MFGDFRTLLEDKSLTVVVIATPDHWHHDQLAESLKAGKDVYLEKPMSLSTEEGARMVKAVRAMDRIVQIGMQRRGNPSIHAVSTITRTSPFDTSATFGTSPTAREGRESKRVRQCECGRAPLSHAPTSSRRLNHATLCHTLDHSCATRAPDRLIHGRNTACG